MEDDVVLRDGIGTVLWVLVVNLVLDAVYKAANDAVLEEIYGEEVDY